MLGASQNTRATRWSMRGPRWGGGREDCVLCLNARECDRPDGLPRVNTSARRRTGASVVNTAVGALLGGGVGRVGSVMLSGDGSPVSSTAGWSSRTVATADASAGRVVAAPGALASTVGRDARSFIASRICRFSDSTASLTLRCALPAAGAILDATNSTTFLISGRMSPRALPRKARIAPSPLRASVRSVPRGSPIKPRRWGRMPVCMVAGGR